MSYKHKFPAASIACQEVCRMLRCRRGLSTLLEACFYVHVCIIAWACPTSAFCFLCAVAHVDMEDGRLSRFEASWGPKDLIRQVRVSGSLEVE